MPFSRPELTVIIDRVKTDIKGGLGVATILRRNFLDIIAKMNYISSYKNVITHYRDDEDKPTFR